VPLFGADVVKDKGGIHQFGDHRLVHLQPHHAVVQMHRLERVAAQCFLHWHRDVLELRVCHRQRAYRTDQQREHFLHGDHLKN
jgi:hypothetical protein